MASTSVEDFVGNGSLKELLPKLFEDGWDDVLTLKVMNSEDMVEINMTREQKVGLITHVYSSNYNYIIQCIISAQNAFYFSTDYTCYN